MSAEAAKWDERYRQARGPGQPVQVLEQNIHLLPRFGSALDLACGLGANALLLASQGLQVTAWDLSPVAIARLTAAAEAAARPLTAAVRDVVAEPPPPRSFDVVLVSRFLERALCPAINASLRPGGLLFYQTFTRTRVGGSGPNNPHYLLAEGELLGLFPELHPVVYRDEALIGDINRGLRGEALLVARKPH